MANFVELATFLNEVRAVPSVEDLVSGGHLGAILGATATPELSASIQRLRSVRSGRETTTDVNSALSSLQSAYNALKASNNAIHITRVNAVGIGATCLRQGTIAIETAFALACCYSFLGQGPSRDSYATQARGDLSWTTGKLMECGDKSGPGLNVMKTVMMFGANMLLQMMRPGAAPMKPPPGVNHVWIAQNNARNGVAAFSALSTQLNAQLARL